MKITEVRIRKVNDGTKLLAYCSVTFSASYVVHDLKIISGPKGPFLAMPNRKLADHCPKCGAKNILTNAFCGACGTPLPEGRQVLNKFGEPQLYLDVFHPTNTEARESLADAVLRAYYSECDEPVTVSKR